MTGLTRLSMPSVEATIKMEDRKRAAFDSIDHSAPPTKRQATVNGSREHPDTDMPWRADVEVRLRPFFTLQCLSLSRNALIQSSGVH